MTSTMAPPDWLPGPGTFTTATERRDAEFARRLAARRKRLLLWSAPLVLIALLAGAKLLSASLINSAGSSAYASASYATAQSRFEDLKFFNVVESWKAYFNEGTARYAAGEFFLATQQFDPALDLVPRAPEGAPRGPQECAVRTNYSLALEGLGDENLSAADPAMASDYYDQARAMLADCGTSGGGGEKAEEAEERQQQHQEEAQQQEQQQQEQQGGEGEEENPSQSPDEGEDSPNESPSDEQSSPGDDQSPEGTDPGESPSEGESGGNESASPSPSEGGSGNETPSTEPSGRPTDPKEQELKDRNDEANNTGEQETGSGLGTGQNW